MELSPTRRWGIVAVALAVVVLLYLLAPILTPFVIAAMLAYVMDPLADRLERWRLSRTMAVVVIFVLLAALLALLLVVLVPILQRELHAMAQAMPAAIDWVQYTVLPWVQQTLGIDTGSWDLEYLKQLLSQHWQQVGGWAGNIFTSLGQSGMTVLGWFANLILVPVVTFYLLRDWDILMQRLHELVPRRHAGRVAAVGRECDEVLGAFLHGQLLVMLALGVVYTLGLWWVGLEMAVLIGLGAGLVSFVPYLGFILGLLAASVAALIQFHDVVHLVQVLLVFGIGQSLESMLLTPYLVGDRIGLHPVAVIFAVMAGGQLFGFFGVLVALPVAAVLLVLLRHGHRRYLASDLYRADDGTP